MKIAILGGGLTGLLVADTLMRNRLNNFDIFEKDKKAPEPSGFMVLHHSFGLKLKQKTFPVYQKGSEHNYKAKLSYDSTVNCSWKKGLEKYYMGGFNPFQAAEKLFSWYQSRMVEKEVGPNCFADISKDYDLVISTIPPFFLKPEVEHNCSSTNVYVEELDPGDEKEGVLYNGYSNQPVLREVNLWGRLIREYSQQQPEKNLTKIEKPIRVIGGIEANYPDNTILAGRRGQWNKHIMLHHVYFQIQHLIQEGVIK